MIPAARRGIADAPAPRRRPGGGAAASGMSRTLSAAALCAALAAGCGPARDPDDLFPLEAGRAWTYRVQTASGPHFLRETLRIEALGARELDGQTVWVRHTSDGTEYYLDRDARGLRRVALRTVLEAEPRWDTPARPVLPAEPVAGQRWSVPARPFLLRRVRPVTEDLGATRPFEMEFTIESVAASVEVPAGRFAGCVHVRGEGSVYLVADPRIGPQDVPIVQDEWYCHGTGLVKLERRELIDSTDVFGGTQTLELEAAR